MEGAYAFTCQLCRARLTLVGSLDAAPGTESAAWGGGRGILVPPHLQASVFDHGSVEESFIVLDGRRQGPGASTSPHALPPHHPHHSSAAGQPQPPLVPPHQLPLSQHNPQLPPPKGLDESFVMLGAASVLRPPGLPPHLPPGLSPLHLQALQQQQQLHHHHHKQQQLLPQGQYSPGPPQGTSGCLGPGPFGLSPPHPSPPSQLPPRAPGPQSPSPPPSTQQQQQSAQSPPQAGVSPPQHPQGLPPGYQLSPPQAGQRRGGGGGGRGPGQGESGAEGDGGGGGGGPAGSGLDSKLQALARLFELASTNTQVDHPLCMDCVGQLKEEMETQIAEAEREIAAYSTCVAQLEAGLGAGTGVGSPGGPAGGRPRSREAEEECQLEEISRLEQERDQERARAEVLESELAALTSELASLSAASADLASLEDRYWHDVNDFELLLRAHTDERGALLAKIDRAGQRLQLLRNTSVLYDAFKIWHDGPFGTISGFRLGRTPEMPVEWDEINAAWGQAVLLLHTMAQMCKVQFSQHRLLPMGSHPRVADKRSTYDLFGPVSKLWSANYDRAMVAYLACLREFGEHARKKDAQDGKPTQFSFPFAIDGDKVNNLTLKLTLNKDAKWTKALKFMLANLKIALQWCVKQDQPHEVPRLQHLGQEGPQALPDL